MPLFALVGRDGARGPALRALHRSAHLAGIEALDDEDRIVHAGPLLDEGGEPRGSLVVFEARDLAEARDIAARDPYVVEGVFERYEVFETRAVFPKTD